MYNWTIGFRSQQTSHMELSATSTTVTGPVGERLQVGTQDTPVLNHPAPLRHLHDSGTGYKYPDLLTYISLVVTPVLANATALHVGEVFLFAQ